MNTQTTGKLFVIDGTDGSGKATQTRLLQEALQTQGYRVESMDFPRYYDNFFGGFIGEALRGEYGDWVTIHPKIASIVYAADRYESKALLQQWLDEGAVVILDRYVSSNQIHQGGKISDPQERTDFLQWLDTMEHEVFGLPRPDAIYYLDVEVAATQELLQKKSAQDQKAYLKGKGDQHETNIQHLTDARNSGLAMFEGREHWYKIICAPDGQMRSIEEIHGELLRMVHDQIGDNS